MIRGVPWYGAPMSDCLYRQHLLPVILSDKFYRGVRRYAQYARVEADELVQIVATRAWQHRERFDPDLGGPEAWLYTMARNEAIRLGTRPHHEIPVDPTYIGRQHAVDLHEEPEALMDTAAACTELLAAMEAIPESQAAALRARYWGDETLLRAGEEIGVPLGTMLSRTYRGRERLREILTDPSAVGGERRAALIREAKACGLTAAA